MNERLHIHKKADSSASFPVQSQFQSRPNIIQAQPDSLKPLTQTEIENQEFQQQKLEATKLEIQAAQGTITPEGQVRLNVLQAKRSDFWQQKHRTAKRYGHNLLNHPIPLYPAGTETAPPVQPKPNIQKADSSPQKTFIDQKAGTPLRVQPLSMGRLPMSKALVQPKLTIGQPGDKYEQEADQVADQVVNQINASAPQPEGQSQPVQREAIPEEEDELQMKPEISTIQREEVPEEEEEIQMKPMVQLQPSGGGMAAAPDLEASIQQARGSGQPLADSIRQPMEQAFGADFSGVKVHTDAQSDQLNQSIQARAFTTGQDVFFRSGEYNPGSRGGQELIAHELTHVVQQNGGAVQRSQHLVEDRLIQEQPNPSTTPAEASLEIPALVHFIWIGKKPTEAAVENINQWVEKAKNTDWKIYLWTDKRYGQPPESKGFNWWGPNKGWGLKGKIEYKEISTALDQRLSQHYERAVSNKAWNMASDLARYSILWQNGGVYADVDIGPGKVSLREIADSSALIAGELPLFGPGLRDRQQLDSMVPPKTEYTLKKRVTQAIDKLNETGQFNNNFIATPSRNALIENIIIACEQKLNNMDDSDIEPSTAMMTTGPTIVLQQIDKYLQEKGVSPDKSRAAIDRMNPLLGALFADLDWLTEESENQTHR